VTTYKVSLHGDLSADAALALCDQLETINPVPLSVSCFEAAGGVWHVEAFHEDTVAAHRFVDNARATAKGAGCTELDVEALGETDWVAVTQRNLRPVVAGPFFVHGAHDRARAAGRRLALEIDAQVAFGTAHHATTVGCLKALARLADQRRHRRVLDLGCGTGILAIAMARLLPNADILATDIDPSAIEIARTNCRINRVGQRVRVLLAAGIEHPSLRARPRFDLVVANILAGPLAVLAKPLAARLSPGADLVLSGILAAQTARVEAAYRAAGFRLATRSTLEEWVTLVLQRKH